MPAKTKKYIKTDDSLMTFPKYEVLYQSTYENGQREYLVVNPDGSDYVMLKSVTSALPKPPNFVLDRWRKKVGFEYAVFSTNASSSFGNRLHDSITRICNQVDSYDDHIFEKYLDEVDYVIAEETEVVSMELRLAGKFDLLVKNKKGEIELIDIKNHSRIHPLEEVKNNLLELPQEIQSSKKKKWKQQGACYVIGLKETYDITVDRFSVWCFNQGTGKIEKPVSIAGKKLQKELDDIPNKLVF